MLSIPFLSTYIQKVVKEQPVADSVDWLNYYCSSLLLAFFALAISAKQYFGQAINCWVPNEFRSGWEKYAEDYCFIANSYYVPFGEEVPTDLSKRADQISYYRWVPVVLAMQALLFWLPNWLWNMLHKQTAVSARAIVNEARKSRALAGAEREKEIESLAAYINDTVSVFSDDQPTRPSGLNASLLYLVIKLLYVLNCFGQLIALNRFLGGQYYGWAYETTLSLLRGEEWRESAVFPRVIMCDFSVRRLANPQRHTIQCVIMLNMINEKLYFFLYFWLAFVGIVTLINFFYYLLMLMVPALRTKFVMRNINKQQQKMRGFGRREIHEFVQYRLRPDGVLLLHFLRQHIGGRVTYDLLNELFRLHWLAMQQQGGVSKFNTEVTGSTASTKSKLSNASSSPPDSENALLLFRGNGKVPTPKSVKICTNPIEEDNNYEGSYSRQDTYKPTAYGPRSALMFPADQQQHLLQPDHRVPATAPPPFFDSASLLRTLTNGVAPPAAGINEIGVEIRNPYEHPPPLDFIDSNGASDQPNDQNQENAAEGKQNNAKDSSSKASSLNATPLMSQSRRSPLITGLGSIGRRRHNNNVSLEIGQNDDKIGSPRQLSTDSDV